MWCTRVRTRSGRVFTIRGEEVFDAEEVSNHHHHRRRHRHLLLSSVHDVASNTRSPITTTNTKKTTTNDNNNNNNNNRRNTTTREAPMFVKSVLPVLRLRGVRFGLAQAGHDIVMQTEADECAREVLTSRFQGIYQPTHASSVAELPEETDVLDVLAGRGGD